MNILAGTLVDILAEEKLVTCKNSMDILADFFTCNFNCFQTINVKSAKIDQWSAD
jgi:hypothetical protein